MPYRRRLLTVLFAVLVATGSTLAQPSISAAARPQEAAVDASARRRIEERCRSLLLGLIEERGLPGASAAMVFADASELAIPVGFADAEAERDMTAHDRLLSGSIGKTYVTAAAHHLMHAGKLSLDDKAAEYFEGAGWFARIPNAQEITILHLLRHQTGIPRHVMKEEFWEALLEDRDRVWEPKELLTFVFDDEPLFPAGEGWAYADTNYIVLGMIIEEVSQQAFYDYVSENLLEPHRLKDTVPSNTRRIPGLTQGVVVWGRSLGLPDRALEEGVFVINPQFEWCGGGYANTPSDLARWARILYSGRAFDAPYLKTMLDAVPAPMLGPGRSYGLGVFVFETDLGPFRGHDGVMVGFLSSMGYLPDHDLALALQFNTDDMRALGRPSVEVMLDLARIVVDELDT